LNLLIQYCEIENVVLDLHYTLSKIAEYVYLEIFNSVVSECKIKIQGFLYLYPYDIVQ